MLIQAPVYSDQNGTHFVNIYEETEDGTFRRTQNEPLRQLRNNIKGISRSQGELISQPYDRQERKWGTATVSFHYGRPQSFYHFLRDMLAKNRFYVFSKPQLSGHLIKFDAHELLLKPGTSQRHLTLLKEKYVEAINLWSEAQLAEQRSKIKAVAKPDEKATSDLDVDFESAKTMIITPGQRERVGLPPRKGEATEAGSNESSAAIQKAALAEKRTLAQSSNSSGGFLRRFLFTID